MSELSRREFLGRTAAAAAALAVSPVAHAFATRHKLGFDNFAVRAFAWKAPQLVDYAATLGCSSILISDLDAFETLDDSYLTSVRQRAAAKNIQIHLGTWSVCPTSKAFKANRGTADAHLALAIRSAKALGSPVIRVVLGTWEDRLTDGGIEKH